jgi:methionine biosynthesis protein MetW
MDNRLKQILGEGECVVDLGCGSGQLLVDLADSYNRRIGLDASIRRLTEMPAAGVGWEFIAADLNSVFPLDDNSVDAVVANQAIEHIVDPAKFCAEVHRILRPGGHGVVTTPNIRYVKNLVHIIASGYGPRTAGGNTLDGTWDDGHLHYFTHRDLRELLTKIGFRRVGSYALVEIEGRGWLRRLMNRHASALLIREFLSGNILVWFEK